jgi:membrane-anchored protein YejM (alkaline phosphatase superfamily)
MSRVDDLYEAEYSRSQPKNDFGFTTLTAEEFANYSGLTNKNDVELTLEQLHDKHNRIVKEYQRKLQEVEGLILPLLNNLKANPEKEYILWKDREKPISDQINRITSITRSSINVS